MSNRQVDLENYERAVAITSVVEPVQAKSGLQIPYVDLEPSLQASGPEL